MHQHGRRPNTIFFIRSRNTNDVYIITPFFFSRNKCCQSYRQVYKSSFSVSFFRGIRRFHIVNRGESYCTAATMIYKSCVHTVRNDNKSNRTIDDMILYLCTTLAAIFILIFFFLLQF